MAIAVSINGEPKMLSPCNLQTLVAEYNQNDTTVAVAVNNEFVSKSKYQETVIENGDTIDIVSPVGGG